MDLLELVGSMNLGGNEMKFSKSTRQNYQSCDFAGDCLCGDCSQPECPVYNRNYQSCDFAGDCLCGDCSQPECPV
jgi:hypothetical protein